MSQTRSSPRRTQISHERKKDIAELAEAVAIEFCPRGERIAPEKIASANGITYSYNDYGDAFDGLLEHRQRGFHIYCNMTRTGGPNEPRSRFTLGHELGHFFIDEHRIALESGCSPAHPSFCDYESTNPVEAEADHFASNLLMPESVFHSEAERMRTGLNSVLSLAEKFGTSLTSTALRYVSLDLIHCTLMKWTAEGLTWKRFSEIAFRAGFRRTVSSIDDIPVDSPTGKALADPQAGPGQIHSGCTTASQWIPYIDTSHFRNDLLMEEAIRIGRFGVLTFLYPHPQAGQF